jgi:FtsP/CotA-like multicopper oxidase with cupredoxin domain
MGTTSTAARRRRGAATGALIGVVVLVLLAAIIGAGAAGLRWTPHGDQPFSEPAGIHSHGGVLTAQLVAETKQIEVAGDSVTARVYNGSFTGPTLFVNPGDTLHVTLVNHLDEPTNLHFHGFHVTPLGTGDNVFREIQPGHSFTYSFRLGATEPPGLAWYHSHLHHLTEEQVYGGMSGMIVVGHIERLAPSLRHVSQRLFALRDIRVVDGEVAQTGLSTKTTRLINSLYQPELTIAPGETQMWRFANIGADLFYRVGLSTPGGPMTFHVISEDGRPVWRVWTATSLVLPPGKRFDVLVTGPPRGTYQLRALPYDQGVMNQRSVVTLATVQSTGTRRTPVAIPAGLIPKDDLREEHVAKTVTKTFRDQFPNFTINGKTFDPDRVDDTATLGTVQKWRLVNASSEEHPFHMHIDYFQVIAENGRPFDANGFQDTVIIPVHGSVSILIDFEDYVGRFVYHCHILNHEDHGMMGTIVVRKPKTAPD